MDLVQIIKENPRARKVILELNIAVIAQKFGIKLSDAKKLQQMAALLDMKEAA
jgi:hypothetical protein